MAGDGAAVEFAVDPPGCGCTDCLTGATVPLDAVSSAQIAHLLEGRLTDRTGVALTVTTKITVSFGDLTWEVRDELA